MKSKHIIKIENEEQWHELRRNHIGGSEVAALFDKSPYTTVNQMYHEKRGHYINDIDSPLMMFGRDLEPIIAKYFSQEFHWELVKCEEYHIHPEHRGLGATLDYYIVESENGLGILEIKNVQSFSPGWTDTRAPDYIELQLQHQLLVVNAARVANNMEPFKWGCIGSLHAGNPEDLRIMMREPDKKIHDLIVYKAKQFWKDVDEGKEPAIFDAKDYQFVGEMFKQAKKVDEEQIDFTNDKDMEKMLLNYEELSFKERKIKKEKDQIKATVMAKLMDFNKDGNTAHLIANCNYRKAELKVIQVNRKPQPAKTTEQIRFSVKTSDSIEGVAV